MLSSAFGGNISQEDIAKMTEGYMKEISGAISADTSKARNKFTSTFVTFTTTLLNEYIEANGSEKLNNVAFIYDLVYNTIIIIMKRRL